MELKQTAIFLGVMGLASVALRLPLGPLLGWRVSDLPATAQSICAENQRLAEFEVTQDRLERMSHTACQGAADALNDQPEKETSVEYREGYLYGLRLKCFSDGQSISAMETCVDEWAAMASTYRVKHGMPSESPF